MPTYLSKRVVVHSKQISLERNRSENSKTLYIKNKLINSFKNKVLQNDKKQTLKTVKIHGSERFWSFMNSSAPRVKQRQHRQEGSDITV